VGAERGFLFRIRIDGGFRVLLARNHDGDSIPRPDGQISHYAVRRALDSGAPQMIQNARRDRRYWTVEGQRTRRQPVSILVLPIRLQGNLEAGLYFDHRFQSLGDPQGVLIAADCWRALMETGFQARERERLLARYSRQEKNKLEQPVNRNPPPAPEANPALLEPVKSVEFHGLVAANPDMLDLIDDSRQLGSSDLPVVIQGETGTGKEVLARAIHRSSVRSAKPFVVVPCGGMPESLLESELFGHARGAFTGAEEKREGLLVQADGGTVLLDEVGDMSPQMQLKLLRVLEDGRVRPLGEKRFRKIDVRIISSTHRNLEKLVTQGRFRKDLYYRLRGAVFSLPSLRERREEILLLSNRFLERMAGSRGTRPPVISEGARKRLLRYTWPGNVRELENEMQRIFDLGISPIQEKHLSSFLRRPARPSIHQATGPGDLEIARIVSEAEQGAIAKALARAGGNKSLAANLLGITRKALYRRMARYGMR